jgi:hypothetical protein
MICLLVVCIGRENGMIALGEAAMPRLLVALSIASIVFCGAIFGFFYAWVCSTMWGLDQADPRVAIAAMKAMNASVRNAVFFPAFFLTRSGAHGGRNALCRSKFGCVLVLGRCCGLYGFRPFPHNGCERSHERGVGGDACSGRH